MAGGMYLAVQVSKAPFAPESIWHEDSAMRQGLLAILAAGLLVGPGVAVADPIEVNLDLTDSEYGLIDGANGDTVELDVTEAGLTVTIKHEIQGDDEFDIWVGTSATGLANSFCFGDILSCAFGGEMSFSRAVQDLMLDVVGWDSVGDDITITAFNGASLLGSLVVSADGTLDFSGFGLITRLLFVDNSDVIEGGEGGYGVGYATIRFSVPMTEVPEPGTLALLGLGLAGLGFSRRRKNA